MKPIHHALVSSRLFGGTPQDYVSLHNHFDLSKAALPDMRHRAALHSCDHGKSVMKMVFKDKSFPGVGISALCDQHVEDDHGYRVMLDDWLRACEVPKFVRIGRKPPRQLALFATDPVSACIEKWGGTCQDYQEIWNYYRLPEQVSDHPLAPAISRNAFGIYFSEAIFGPAITILRNDGRPKYVPVRDIGECITLAKFGRIPTLGDVFQHMRQEAWMTGSKVAQNRKSRTAATNLPNLFSTELDADHPRNMGDQDNDQLTIRNILMD